MHNNLFDDDVFGIARDDTVVLREFSKEVIRQNTKIVDQDMNWNVLLHKEALHINRLNTPLNNGLKASRNPILFR